MTIAYFQKKHSPRIRFVARSRLTGLAGGNKRWAEGPTRAGGRQGPDGGQGLRREGKVWVDFVGGLS